MPREKKDIEAPNGHLRNGVRLAQDVEEFELDGLTSEDESGPTEEESLLKEERQESSGKA
jgi:hypothetical protein